jgi:hypothetical protein
LQLSQYGREKRERAMEGGIREVSKGTVLRNKREKGKEGFIGEEYKTEKRLIEVRI